MKLFAFAFIALLFNMPIGLLAQNNTGILGVWEMQSISPQWPGPKYLIIECVTIEQKYIPGRHEYRNFVMLNAYMDYYQLQSLSVFGRSEYTDSYDKPSTYPVGAMFHQQYALGANYPSNYHLFYDPGSRLLIADVTQLPTNYSYRLLFRQVLLGEVCPSLPSRAIEPPPPRVARGDDDRLVPVPRTSREEEFDAAENRESDDEYVPRSRPQEPEGPTIVTVTNRSNLDLYIFFELINPGGSTNCVNRFNKGQIAAHSEQQFSIPEGKIGFFEFKTCPYACGSDCSDEHRTDFDTPYRSIHFEIAGGTGEEIRKYLD